MALTGFDPSVVSTSINGVITAYNGLVNAFGTQMQTKIVDGMSDKWACNQAIDAFTEVKSEVDRLMENIDRVFESIVASMNSAARSWATSTRSDYSDVSLNPYNQKLNIGNIMENIGGVRGIDLQNSNSVIAYLTTITQNSDENLDSAKKAVAASGFVGGDMQSQIDSSLATIRNNIHNAVDSIDTSLKSYMEQTVAEYGDLEGKVSQAFAGQQ